MTKHDGSSGMFTNVQAIKNLMNQYDKDGDYIDPTMTGTVMKSLHILRAWAGMRRNRKRRRKYTEL